MNLYSLSTQEYSFVHERPSAVAAAALWLALKLDPASGSWSDKLSHYSGYEEAEVASIGQRIAHLVVNLPSSKTNYVYTKYQSSKYLKIAATSVVHGQMIKDIAKMAHP